MWNKVKETFLVNGKIYRTAYLIVMLSITFGMVKEVAGHTEMNPATQSVFGLMVMVMFLAVINKVSRR